MSCRNKKIRAMLGAIVLTASMTVTAVGCGNTSAGSTETADAVTESQTEAAEASNIDGILDSSDMFTNRDKEIGYDEESAIAINLSDGASTADSDSVVIDGDTITITEEETIFYPEVSRMDRLWWRQRMPRYSLCLIMQTSAVRHQQRYM